MSPQFRHTYPYEKVYPDSGLMVGPFEVITADKNPDPHNFEEITPPPTKAKQAATEAPEPKETD